MKQRLAITPHPLVQVASRAGRCALFAAIAASAPLFGGTSGVVGLYPISLPTGDSAWVSGLVSADEYEGTSTQVTTAGDGRAQVSFSSPGWTANQFSGYYAEPQSGICAGLAIDIVSNTDSQLTLDTTPSAAGLTTGMTLIIRKHATLGTLLPSGGGFQPLVDSIGVFDSTGQQSIYVYNDVAGYWMDGSNTNANNVIIKPGQGFVIHVVTPKSITIGLGSVCHVKSSPTKVRIASRVPTIVGPLNPLSINTNLGSLGIAGTMQALNDSVVVLAQGTLNPTGTYLSNGSSLITGRGQNANSVALPTGSGVVINADTAKNLSLNPVTVSP